MICLSNMWHEGLTAKILSHCVEGGGFEIHLNLGSMVSRALINKNPMGKNRRQKLRCFWGGGVRDESSYSIQRHLKNRQNIMLLNQKREVIYYVG